MRHAERADISSLSVIFPGVQDGHGVVFFQANGRGRGVSSVKSAAVDAL